MNKTSDSLVKKHKKRGVANSKFEKQRVKQFNNTANYYTI